MADDDGALRVGRGADGMSTFSSGVSEEEDGRRHTTLGCWWLPATLRWRRARSSDRQGFAGRARFRLCWIACRVGARAAGGVVPVGRAVVGWGMAPGFSGTPRAIQASAIGVRIPHHDAGKLQSRQESRALRPRTAQPGMPRRACVIDSGQLNHHQPKSGMFRAKRTLTGLLALALGLNAHGLALAA